MNNAVVTQKTAPCVFDIWLWIGAFLPIGLVLSCQPADIPVRLARTVPLVPLEESDSTALIDVTQSRLVGDSMLLALDYQAGDIRVFNPYSGKFLWCLRIPPEAGDQLDQQYPDTVPPCYLEVTGRGEKLDPLSAVSNGFIDDYRRQRCSIRGFTIYNSDSIGVISDVQVPYLLDGSTGFGKKTLLPFTILYLTSLRSNLGKAMNMPAVLSTNFAPVGNAIVACDSGFWMSAWDWYERDRFKDGGHPGPFVRSAKYSRDGRFVGILSRESPNYADSTIYRRGNQWLLNGTHSGSIIRVISTVPAVDVVDASDGTFKRHELPRFVHPSTDSMNILMSDPVRFGARRLAVKATQIKRSKTVGETFIVIGDLDQSGRGLIWKSVLRLNQSDALLSLVDSNDSPLYRKDLLGIFENVERGPYLARIVVD